MNSMEANAAATLERPSDTSADLRWDRIRAARAKIRNGDYDFDPMTEDMPAGVCLVTMLRDVLNVA